MPKDNSGSSKSFIFSVVIHVVFFTALLSSFTFETESKPIMVNLQKEPKIVKAKMIDSKSIQAAEALQRQKLAQEKLLAEQELAEQRRAEQLELDKIKQVEQAKLAEQLKQQKLQKDAEAKATAIKEAALAKEMAKQSEAKKAELQKKLAAQQLQAKKESEKQAVAKQAAEKQAVAKQAAAKQAAAKQASDKLAAEKAAANAAAVKAEQDRLSAQHNEFLLTEVEKYRAEIQGSIEDNRILSAVFVGDISCKIRIKLLPDGSIATVSVVESSGNKAYDEMSAAAVYKSAPFPMPQDQELYSQLRDIVLSFKNGEQSTDVF